MALGQIFVVLFYLYFSVGLVFGLWFVFAGVHRIDVQMHHASWRTRLLLLPGAAGLWVVLFNKWLKTPTKRDT
jgi:hypothetical protein